MGLAAPGKVNDLLLFLVAVIFFVVKADEQMKGYY